MKKRTLAFFLALLALAALPHPTGAQMKFQMWPGAAYDPAIPTFKQVLGYDVGERITNHPGLMKYFEVLAAAAPGRMVIFEHGKSWEGRKLVHGVIGSEANIKRLDEIRAGMDKLSDPRKTTPSEAKSLAESLPAVVWLGYSVHGNEIAPADSALFTAYHLLAARNDKTVDDILQSALVIIDPIENPDGRNRFINHFESAEGMEPSPSPLSAEHNEPWPSGRLNHYCFDMNRDWFALTQPETQGRIATFLKWHPVISADVHEMGSDSTYYFPPPAPPTNPNLAKDVITNTEMVGRNIAKWFDANGIDYFNREVYDAFYPGYGDSWPAMNGTIAMTFEQGSVRGLVVKRSDGKEIPYRESVRNHFVASVATCEAGAKNRTKILEDYFKFRVSAIEEGKKEAVREFILPRRGDVSAVDKLAALLERQGVEVQVASSPFKAGGQEYPAGSYVVSCAQPAKRLIRSILDKNTPLDSEFLKRQESRRKRNLPDELYDITAWSLPLAFNVEAIPNGADSTAGGKFARWSSTRPAPTVADGATVAYLVPWGTAASGRFLCAGLREGLRMYSADKPFTQQGRTFPAGTLIIKPKDHSATLAATLRTIAAATDAEVVATNTAWVEDGINFGSNNVVYMRKPEIAIAWDAPTAATSTGAAWFVLERQFNYPVTVIRCGTLGSADLSRFHVLILPDLGRGSYSSVFGDDGRRLRAWVAAGGVLIGINQAVGFLSDPKVGLLALNEEQGLNDAKKDSKPGADGRVPGSVIKDEEEFNRLIEPSDAPPDNIPGAILTARLAPEHWLTAGLPATVNAMAEGNTIYAPIKLDRGVNAAVYESGEKVLASGYLWEENKKQYANKPLVVVQPVGRGYVVGFTADPNYRAFFDGLNMLFINSIFRGAAHARPAN